MYLAHYYAHNKFEAMRPLPDGGAEALKALDTSHAGANVGRVVQAQLTQPGDVSAAHQFMTATGGDLHLPQMPAFSGAEATGLHAAIAPGSETSVLTAAQQIGNQAISPIIQMIMRMPGHLGLISSFFEALQNFFAPLKEALGAFDPTLLLEHAQSALHSASSSIGEHMPMDFNLLSEHAHVFDGLANHASMAMSEGAQHALTGHLDLSSLNPSEHLSAMKSLNVNGFADLKNAQFEQGSVDVAGFKPDAHTIFAQNSENQYLAMNNSSATFHATVGSAPGQPGGVDPSATNATTPVDPQPTPTSTTASAGQNSILSRLKLGSARGDLLGHAHPDLPSTNSPAGDVSAAPEAAHAAGTPEAGAQAAQPGAESAPSGDLANSSYTIKSGDTLWDIAKKTLGDGLKWQEVYKLNQDLLGTDPSLIHAGTEIQLPGMQQQIAEYIVKPGDNLWSISEHQLGNGQNWSELYHHNADIVGSDPSMIHPGQHLSVQDHGQLADASHGAASGPSATSAHPPTAHAVTAHGAPSGSHLAHAPHAHHAGGGSHADGKLASADHPGHSGMADKAGADTRTAYSTAQEHAHVASKPAGLSAEKAQVDTRLSSVRPSSAEGPAPEIASNYTGGEVALHAQQPLGALQPVAGSSGAASYDPAALNSATLTP